MPGWRRWNHAIAVGCAAAVVAVSYVSGAPAMVGQRTTGPPAGAPALDQMALAVGDLPTGAAVRHEGYVRDKRFDSYYVREFAPGAMLGGSRLTSLESDVGLASSAPEAIRLVGSVSTALHARGGRRGFARSALIDAGWDPNAMRITSVGFRKVVAGDSSLFAIMTLTLPGPRRFVLTLGLTRVDRAIQLLYALGAPNAAVSPAEPIALLGVVAARMRAGLLPFDVVAPAITGVPQVGQVLTADPGVWSNTPTSFATQWLRCAPAGAQCVVIPGAAGAMYPVTSADVGSMLEVSVLATNGVGSSRPAISLPTAVVAPPPAA